MRQVIPVAFPLSCTKTPKTFVRHTKSPIMSLLSIVYLTYIYRVSIVYLSYIYRVSIVYLSYIYRISIVFSLRIVRELWDLGVRKEKASSLLKRGSLQKECAMSTIKFGLFIFFEGNNLQKECTYKHYRTRYISPFGRNSLPKG